MSKVTYSFNSISDSCWSTTVMLILMLCKVRGQDRAIVYISDVPGDDWLTGVDAREARVTRKIAGKRPVAEGPS
jgi:hypothetical protein